MSLSVPADDLRLSGEKYSDLTIQCNGHRFSVHKIIVCTQSPVFAAACDGGFEEASSGIFNVTNYQPSTVKNMVDFLYKGQYTDNESANSSESSLIPGVLSRGPEPDIPKPNPTGDPKQNISISDPNPALYLAPSGEQVMETEPELDSSTRMAMMLRPHIYVNSIADFYKIPSLAQLAVKKIQDILDRHWCIDDFLNSAILVYQVTGDDELRDLVAKTIRDHIDEIRPRLEGLSLIKDAFVLEVFKQMNWKTEQLQAEKYRLEHELKDCGVKKQAASKQKGKIRRSTRRR